MFVASKVLHKQDFITLWTEQTNIVWVLYLDVNPEQAASNCCPKKLRHQVFKNVVGSLRFRRRGSTFANIRNHSSSTSVRYSSCPLFPAFYFVPSFALSILQEESTKWDSVKLCKCWLLNQKAIDDDMTLLDQKDSWDPLWVKCKNKNWLVQRFAKNNLFLTKIINQKWHHFAKPLAKSPRAEFAP